LEDDIDVKTEEKAPDFLDPIRDEDVGIESK
jgi:hypothetical protein